VYHVYDFHNNNSNTIEAATVEASDVTGKREFLIDTNTKTGDSSAA